MSKSDLSIMSNFNGKSMCKGNSKKEKELNMNLQMENEDWRAKSSAFEFIMKKMNIVV